MKPTRVLLKSVQANREKVFTDSYTTTWREIINLYKDQDIVIDPEYQRLFRWDLERQTQFIESLLLNIPTPAIFFAEDESDKLEIIDGLQRISTLIRFFSEDIFKDPDLRNSAPDAEGDNDLKNPLCLSAGPILEELEGYTSEKMPSPLLRSIKNARVPVILLQKESGPKTKYQVFQRLNRAGAILADQEIRNATARLLDSDFPDKLRTLAKNKSVIDALKVRDVKQKEMYVEELLLRLLALCHSPHPFQKDLALYLDDFMEYAASGNFQLDNERMDTITRTFSLISQVYPEGAAFRFAETGKGQFSSNLFDIVATGVYRNVNKLTSAKVKSGYKKLMKDPTLSEVTGGGSNTKRKMEARVSLGQKYFSYP
ncbi:DUF262 domain-containing protein [Thiohalomonas denitrificans]|uniref:GmrSD restriction endonucleases N-terminal domain-containing protein n=1 Tax=Thiohalomonas denitrificans TaxID=415747 RepID=A0A1G5Q700_9GAMM|nr:DUF262 domain-containing protein [Thiohalomonas denitrificans]SCZ57059.1 Protein of unknown function DUF262 [Thiohalomonas denitrificans]